MSLNARLYPSRILPNQPATLRQMNLDWVLSLALAVPLIVCSLVAIRLWEKHEIRLFLHRAFANLHQRAVRRRIERRISYVIVLAKFTNGALKFIDTNCARESTVLIVPRYRYLRGRIVGTFLPYAEAKLGVAHLGMDFIKVQSNAQIPVLVGREICEVLKQEKISLIVTTSGFWKFRKLKLKDDLSWLLWKQDTRREARRPSVIGPA